MLETLLWYSRYSVWVGAIVLLLQAITGRSIGLITLLAVLLLGIGFVVFLVVLGWDGLQLPLQLQPAAIENQPAPATTVPRKKPVTVPVEPSPGRPPEPAARIPPSPEPVQHAPDRAQEPPPHAPSPVRLPTQALTADSPLVGASCGVCAKRLRAGQVVVRCPECRAVQHATCWTDNGFTCGVEDCAGRGSLEAPTSV